MVRLNRSLTMLFVVILLVTSSSRAVFSSPVTDSTTAQSPIVRPDGPNFSIVGHYSKIRGKPAIAFDGTNFMIAYCQDEGVEPESCTSVHAMRLTLDGDVIDPAGIAITTSGNDRVGTPSIQFDGENFLIVWVGTRTVNDIVGDEIYGARVTKAGDVLEPNGKVLTNGALAKTFRAIGLAFDGTNYLVSWRTYSDAIYAARINKNAENLDAPIGIPVPGSGFYPAVAFDGTNYMVTYHGWGNDLDIYGVRISKEGIILDPDRIIICGEEMGQQHNTIAFDGLNYWVVWYDARPNNDLYIGRIYAARVSPEGVVLDSPALLVSERARGQWPPSLACDGSGCLVTYNVETGFNNRIDDVYAKRLTQDGKVLDAQAIPVSTTFWHQYAPMIGYGDNNFLVAWNELQQNRVQDSIWGQQLVSSVPVTQSVLPESSKHAQPNAVIQPASDWVAETIPVIEYAIDGFAFSANDVHLFDYNRRIYKNINGWQSEEIPVVTHLFASWGRSGNDIWAGGWCRASSHFDGTTWTLMICVAGDPYGTLMTGYWYADAHHLWSSGDHGSLFWTDPSNPTPLSSSLVPGITPYDLEDIGGTGPTNGYAVGERGTLLHYDGSQWSQVSPTLVPTIQTLNAVWVNSPNDIFVVGDWGSILHYDGTDWIEQTSGTTWHLYDVWGWGGSNVYAVGLNGTILHYDGTSWQPETSGTTQDLWTVFGVVDPASRLLHIWTAGVGTQLLSKTFPVEVSFLPMVGR